MTKLMLAIGSDRPRSGPLSVANIKEQSGPSLSRRRIKRDAYWSTGLALDNASHCASISERFASNQPPTEEQYAVNLLRAGASGFFAKAGEANDLLEALRTIIVGRKYISHSLAEVLALEAAGHTPEPLHRRLSSREFQVFVHLACGKMATEIAEEIHLSVKTIGTYRTRILQKMECTRNANLTAYALKHKLMD